MWGLPRHRILALTIIVIAAVLAGEWYYLSSRSKRTNEGAIEVIPMQRQKTMAKTPGRIFILTDHHGRGFDSSRQGGELMLLVFGYTFCPDICPTTLQNLITALDQIGARADLIQPILITVDPERDTSDVLADYVAAFHPRLIGLTGSSEDIKSITRDFRVYVQKAPGEEDYLVDHSIFIYLVDRSGRTLKYFPGTLSVEDIVKQITPILTSNN
jgi:protein SCO1/2